MVKIRVLQPYSGAEGRSDQMAAGQEFVVSEARVRELEQARHIGNLVEIVERDLPAVLVAPFPADERAIEGARVDITVEVSADATVRDSERSPGPSIILVDETKKATALAPKQDKPSATFTCPQCKRDDFASERAVQTHINRAHAAPEE